MSAERSGRAGTPRRAASARRMARHIFSTHNPPSPRRPVDQWPCLPPLSYLSPRPIIARPPPREPGFHAKQWGGRVAGGGGDTAPPYLIEKCRWSARARARTFPSLFPSPACARSLPTSVLSHLLGAIGRAFSFRSDGGRPFLTFSRLLFMEEREKIKAPVLMRVFAPSIMADSTDRFAAPSSPSLPTPPPLLGINTPGETISSIRRRR